SFVNSQEWTLSRTVPDLRLGIVGSLSSGKSALVHRYLTGSYMQEESPEEGQSFLLLIRDEGGPPELQFTSWVDAVIFVFSLENESSFSAVYNYYSKMAHFRNPSEVPLILVGTQDAISENNPRIIDDARARKLASDLKRCSYYETCATYGLNVERVFQDACQKIVQQRMATLTPTNSRPSTPNHSSLRCNYYIPSPTNNGFNAGSNNPLSTSPSNLANASPSHNAQNVGQFKEATRESSSKDSLREQTVMRQPQVSLPPPPQHPPPPFEKLIPCDKPAMPSLGTLPPPPKDQKDLPTPSSTPTTTRKHRRRSNLFTVSSLPLKKGDEDKKVKNGEVGSGRAIPLKQGYLYKRSMKALNKEWKKKYVTLCDDGRLTYHPSLHDYMDDVHGKDIPLVHTTVKIPGQKPRGSRSQNSSNTVNGITNEINSLSISGGGFHTNLQAFNKDKSRDKDVLLTAYEVIREGQAPRSSSVSSNCDDSVVIPNSSITPGLMNGSEIGSSNTIGGKNETPNVKKRHRRMKSSGLKNVDNLDDSDGYEFMIVSLDNKQWHFEAPNTEERELWVQAIEQQILNSLQSNETTKSKSRMNSLVEAANLQAIRTSVWGNAHCVDCDAPNPDWASLNLGAVMCIECSGIHRNLGSHISRVRSLDLDEWPPGHIAVMMQMGNQVANSIWEANLKGKAKPTPNSSREEKERWIRAKYENKEFLASVTQNISIGQQLIDAVCKQEMRVVALLLSRSTSEQVNTTVSSRDLRTPLHLACAMGNLAITQLLIWHNANVKSVDHEGRSALIFAHNSGSQEIQDLLVNNGCRETMTVNSTLPRRKNSVTRKNPEVFDKLPASII
uniref:Gtpase-activating protein centaurin gamma n=1 Tax=Strigamia maritima TaxID=126957 RepID=T1IUZ3_STRMM